jgi:hypothetical protein
MPALTYQSHAFQNKEERLFKRKKRHIRRLMDLNLHERLFILEVIHYDFIVPNNVCTAVFRSLEHLFYRAFLSFLIDGNRSHYPNFPATALQQPFHRVSSSSIW